MEESRPSILKQQCLEEEKKKKKETNLGRVLVHVDIIVIQLGGMIFIIVLILTRVGGNQHQSLDEVGKNFGIHILGFFAKGRISRNNLGVSTAVQVRLCGENKKKKPAMQTGKHAYRTSLQ
jgi:hypothetical protein